VTQQKDSQTLRRWFAVGVVVVVVLAIGLILHPFAMPIAWAAILGFLLGPLQENLTRRLRGRASLAASAIIALTPIAIFTPLTLLTLSFVKQLSGLGAIIQQNTQMFDLNNWADPAQHPRVASWMASLDHRFGVQIADIEQYLRDGAQNWAGTVAKSGGMVVLNAASMLLSFMLMLFILFFILRDGPHWFGRVTALLPLAKHRREALFERLGKVLRAVVYGCGLTALVQGTLVSIGFAIARLPGPIVFGVAASVLALLPFGGAAIVWVPGMLYLLAIGKIGWAVFMLVWGLFVSTADNFIRPVIISRYTPVPTLLVFLGVIGGVAAFGALGFVIGPVILVLATELLRYAEGSMSRVE
jgi:predicted PurR-regulated permease PerM